MPRRRTGRRSGRSISGRIGRAECCCLSARRARARVTSPRFGPERPTRTVARGESLDLVSLELGDQASALLIEDVDRIGQAEDRLFHLVNAALQNGVWTLLTARAAPEAWDLKTPDLLSRLRLAPVIRLEAPDIELTEAVLFKLFSDRQLQVEPRVVAYIAVRIERSLGEARKLVDTLDREALALGRRVTRAMASELLREVAPEDDSP